MDADLTRRNLLKLSGAAAGGLVVGGAMSGRAAAGRPAADRDSGAAAVDERPPSERYTWFENLEPFHPGTETLAADEMRVTFLGTLGYIQRLNGMGSSVFVELGNGDSFVFDLGAGALSKYGEMMIPASRMGKVFLTHLHADHTSDLTTLFPFGVSTDRKFPLYVWGPTRSEVPDPVTGVVYDDGTEAYCRRLREVLRWNSEAFSFQNTGTTTYEPPKWAPQHLTDGFDLVPFELDWRKGRKPGPPAIAYHDNGVMITHFPAVHDRQGSISYKLHWNGLSMIFTGDTKPSQYVIDQATQGVDLLVHEIHEPAEITVYEAGGSPDQPGWTQGLEHAQMVIDNSHTPSKAFGYILSQLKHPPRLAVATHFPSADDTVEGTGLPDWLSDDARQGARRDIRTWYPDGDVSIAQDFLVVNVTKAGIRQRRGIATGYAWIPPGRIYNPDELTTPKYHTLDGDGDPYAQLDPDAPVIDPDVYNAR